MRSKQELINKLCKLYRLRDEGKNVEVLIEQVEEELYETMDGDKARKKSHFGPWPYG